MPKSRKRLSAYELGRVRQAYDRRRIDKRTRDHERDKILLSGTECTDTRTQRLRQARRGYGLATMEISTQKADTDNPMQQRD